jgi:Sulfotransferase family
MTGTRLSLDGMAAAPDAGTYSATVIIILAYPHTGGERLSSLLARQPDLACTNGTGILPLCEQAAAAWRAVDGRSAGPPSRLAETSTRVLVTSMITALLARQGKRRWCEIAAASPDTAGIFLRLFPATRIVCLHRACPDFVRAAVHASPWGLAGPAYAPFTSAYPASTTAALTAYWAARTTSLLAFEQAHPGAAHRVRYEDLAAGSSSCLPDLGLQDPGRALAAWRHDEVADPGRSAAGPDADFPAGQVPAPLLEQANRLMEQLGYEPMGPGTAPARPSRWAAS